MECQPRQVLGGQVEDEHDRSRLERFRGAQQLTGDPNLLERPADVGLAPAHRFVASSAISTRCLIVVDATPHHRRGHAARPARTLQAMGDIDDRLRDLLDRRRDLPGSIAVMETHAEAAAINRHLCELENLTMRLAACWDGELDQIGAFSQIAYLHEKAERAELAARDIRKAIERISGWDQPAPKE
jgi:hypothetical protein